MTYNIFPSGVCSQMMQVELDENNVIVSLQVASGCHGNLQGIAALLQGMQAEEAIRRLRGIRCGGRPTSCPDQLAKGLEEILAKR